MLGIGQSQPDSFLRAAVNWGSAACFQRLPHWRSDLGEASWSTASWPRSSGSVSRLWSHHTGRRREYDLEEKMAKVGREHMTPRNPSYFFLIRVLMQFDSPLTSRVSFITISTLSMWCLFQMGSRNFLFCILNGSIFAITFIKKQENTAWSQTSGFQIVRWEAHTVEHVLTCFPR